MIKLQVIGNLGKDCTTNEVNGKNVINFNVAHTESYKDNKGEKMQKTTWVECAYWTDKTGIAPYLKKGTMVFVEGSPEVRTYPKNDGTTGVSLTLRVGLVQLLGNPTGGNSGEQTTQAPATTAAAKPNTGKPATKAEDITEPIDDLPF